MTNSHPPSLDSAPREGASTAVIIGIWLAAAVVSAGLTYALREWSLFLGIACFFALTAAFVPRNPKWRAVTAGVATGVAAGLASLL